MPKLARDENLKSLLVFRRQANEILAAILEASGQRDYLRTKGLTAGYYAIYSRASDVPFASFFVGTLALDKALAHDLAVFVLEKNRQAAEYSNLYTSSDISGSELRHGAVSVRGVEFHHAFAGVPQNLGEVFCVLMAVFLGDMSFERAANILGSSRNSLYIPIVSLRQKVEA